MALLSSDGSSPAGSWGLGRCGDGKELSVSPRFLQAALPDPFLSGLSHRPGRTWGILAKGLREKGPGAWPLQGLPVPAPSTFPPSPEAQNPLAPSLPAPQPQAQR